MQQKQLRMRSLGDLEILEIYMLLKNKPMKIVSLIAVFVCLASPLTCYATGLLSMRGVHFDAGIEYGSPEATNTPVFDKQQVKREMLIIKNDLHANSVRVAGTEIERLEATAELALKEGLDVWFSPHYFDMSHEETTRRTVIAARVAEKLRKKYRHRNVVFVVGCELSIFMPDILNGVTGATFLERLAHPNFGRALFDPVSHANLNAFLSETNSQVKEVFRGRLTYAAVAFEGVDWEPYDYIGIDHYRAGGTVAGYIQQLNRFLGLGKPVVITEVGICAYDGATARGSGCSFIHDPQDYSKIIEGIVRDEEEQAEELSTLLTALNSAGVAGTFVFTFSHPALTHDPANPRTDLDVAGYSLVKTYADGRKGEVYRKMPWDPKKAFYAVGTFYSQFDCCN